MNHTNIISPLKTKMPESNYHWSLTSLHINRFNFTIKKHILVDWIHKQDPAFCCICKTHISDKDRPYLRVTGWKKIFQANDPKKHAGIAVLIPNKIDVQPKVIQKRWGRTVQIHQRKNPLR
jgi:exonuclease III